MKKHAKAVHLRETIALADRLHTRADGSRWFIRFSQVEMLEHWALLIAFVVLGFTGLLQRYTYLDFAAWMTNAIFGGIATLRLIHQVAALVMGGLTLFHIGHILYVWLVKGEAGALMPRAKDMADLFQVIRYNLGISKERPPFGRFTIEEKLGYWALLGFTPLMVLTGLALWFPTVVTRFLPGELIPIARALHGLTAILGIAGVLIWHLYYTLIKERNFSIFTGLLSERAMKENHSLEYRRIIAAHDEIQKTHEEI